MGVATPPFVAWRVPRCAADWVWPQYRELGVIFYRGYTYEQCANQCAHNELDATKGRQLPMHIGSPELFCQCARRPS